jgi:cytochrome c oxidase subunit IV
MSHAPITPVGTYVNIFVALLVLTAATYIVATFDFGLLNTPIALAVAGLKAYLVVNWFMGVRYNTPLTKVVVVSGLFWLLIMFGLTLNDYLTRDWMGVAGR